MVYNPEKRVKLANQILLNILENTSIKNPKLAKEIAHKWMLNS